MRTQRLIVVACLSGGCAVTPPAHLVEVADPHGPSPIELAMRPAPTTLSVPGEWLISGEWHPAAIGSESGPAPVVTLTVSSQDLTSGMSRVRKLRAFQGARIVGSAHSGSDAVLSFFKESVAGSQWIVERLTVVDRALYTVSCVADASNIEEQAVSRRCDAIARSLHTGPEAGAACLLGQGGKLSPCPTKE